MPPLPLLPPPPPLPHMPPVGVGPTRAARVGDTCRRGVCVKATDGGVGTGSREDTHIAIAEDYSNVCTGSREDKHIAIAENTCRRRYE